MGMEILGKRGGYFGMQAGGWYDLASYFNLIAPDICASCKYWYSNDYDGLDVAGAVALADALQVEIDAGRYRLHRLPAQKRRLFNLVKLEIEEKNHERG
jgi:hypothetical protein